MPEPAFPWAAGGAGSGPPAAIRLESVAKRYPGQLEPAVRDMSFDVLEGETVVLLGPSGCGKTTTLRLINRLISPDEGRIFVGGRDVAAIDPDDLRRGIGYVIQEIGLFPHMTVAQNVATVPRMLGWSRERTGARVEELLAAVGLEPATYRDRYPRDLSGGQQQRVGVARAVASDPPVLLMDEPFGSVDPVTRDRLQELLRSLQEQMRKTILFVTHDIDEAVKVGDRIALMNHGGAIEQYDSPARLLSLPASGFVREFVGPGATLKALSLERVGDVELEDWPALPADAPRAQVRDEIVRSGREAALLVDERRRPQCWVTAAELERAVDPLARPGTPVGAPLRARDDLREALERVVSTPFGRVVVVDDDGALEGVLELAGIHARVDGLQESGGGDLRAATPRSHHPLVGSAWPS